MAVIYSVSDGNIAAAADLNQLVTALNSVLGITDTAQTNLGKLSLPWLTADPSSPPSGSVWMRSNLGAAGRLMARHSGASVPYLPYRQEVYSANNTGQTVTSQSYVDLTDLTLSITTTGGALHIWLIPSHSVLTGDCSLSLFGTGAQGRIGFIRAVVGGQNLHREACGTAEGGTGANIYVPASSFHWVYKPAAGTYTVKLQALIVSSGASLTFAGNHELYVQECGD